MAKMYAWTLFRTKIDEYGKVQESIQPGEAVTQDKLGVDDDEWESLIESGAVSEEEYPENLPAGVSPAEYLRAKRAAGELDEVVLTVEESVTPNTEPTESAETEKSTRSSGATKESK